MNLNYEQLEKITEIDENKDFNGDSIYYISEIFSDLNELFDDVGDKIYESKFTRPMHYKYICDINTRLNSIIMNDDLVFAYKMITEKKTYDQIQTYILLYDYYISDLQVMFCKFKKRELLINDNLNRIDSFIGKNKICYDIRGLIINFLC